VPVPWALKPASQYRQSKVHTLPSLGVRFTPSDTPSRRECMGPNIVEWNNTVCIFYLAFSQRLWGYEVISCPTGKGYWVGYCLAFSQRL